MSIQTCFNKLLDPYIPKVFIKLRDSKLIFGMFIEPFSKLKTDKTQTWLYTQASDGVLEYLKSIGFVAVEAGVPEYCRAVLYHDELGIRFDLVKSVSTMMPIYTNLRTFIEQTTPWFELALQNVIEKEYARIQTKTPD